MAVDFITHFNLERSTDGQSWSPLAVPVPGGGSVRSFIDTEVPLVKFFYRLTGFTNNGITIPYNIVSVTGNPKGAFQWVQTPMTTGDDAGRGVDTDSQGNVWYTGSQAGGMCLAKYSPTGLQIQRHVFGSANGLGIACDADGNAYVTGYFQGAVDLGNGVFLPGNGAYESLFVAKYNPACDTLIWGKAFNASGNTRGTSIKVNSQGEVLLCGYFQGSINFGGGDVSGQASQNIFLTKLNRADGSYLNARVFGPTGGLQNVASSISIGPSDTIWMSGWFAGALNIGISTTMSNGFDIFIAKFDTNLNALHFQRFGGSSDDRGYAIAAYLDGGCVFGGVFKGQVNFGGSTFSNTGFIGYDGFVCRVNGDGEHQWSKHIVGNTTGLDEVNALAVDSNGFVLVGGTISGTGDFGSGPIPAGPNDALIMKLNSLGVPSWVKTFGDYSIDKAIGICSDPSRNVIAVGTWSGTVNLGDGDRTGAGQGEGFVIKYSP